jgi:hypothetical protein
LVSTRRCHTFTREESRSGGLVSYMPKRFRNPSHRKESRQGELGWFIL